MADPFTTAQATATSGITAMAKAQQTTAQQLASALAANASLQQQHTADAAQHQKDQSTIASLAAQLAAATQPAIPPPPSGVITVSPPASVDFPTTRTYCVSLNGSDSTGNGSQAWPFATFTGARLAASADGKTGLCRISYNGGGHGTLDPAQWAYKQNNVGRSGTVFDSYNGIANVTADGMDNPFNLIGARDVHFRNLDGIGTNRNPALPTNWFNGSGDNVTIEQCYLSGWTFPIAFLGGNGFRGWNNVITRALGIPGTMSGSGLYTQGDTGTDIQGNFFYGCGIDPVNYNAAWLADVMGPSPTPQALQLLQDLQYFHSCYENETGSNGWNFKFNFLVNSAAIGLHARALPGTQGSYNVYVAGGNGPDAALDGLSTSEQFSLVIGGREWDLYGGGIAGKANNLDLHDIYFLSNSKRCGNPAVIVQPTIHGDPTKPYSAKIARMLGVWPLNNPGLYPTNSVWVDPIRTATTVIDAATVKIRQARAGEAVPNLNDLLGTSGDEATATAFIQNFRGGLAKYQTPAIINAAAAWIAANP